MILASLLQRPDLPFADVLPEQAIEKAFDDEHATLAEDGDAIFTPAVTRVAVLLVALKRGPCYSNKGAYCRAPGKLSEKVIRQITISVGEGCEDKLGKELLWRGRHVRLVDG